MRSNQRYALMFSVWRTGLLAKMLSNGSSGGRRKGRKSGGKGETPWKRRAGGQLLEELGILCHDGGWFEEDIGVVIVVPGSLASDVTRAQRAAAGLVLVLSLWFIPVEDLVQCTLKICCCPSEAQNHFGGVLQGVLWRLMDPNQPRCAQQLLSQEQALSLLALSHKRCFVGRAAEQNEFQYWSLYFVVLALISHTCNVAGGETPQQKQES